MMKGQTSLLLIALPILILSTNVQKYKPQQCRDLFFLPIPQIIDCDIKSQDITKINPCALSFKNSTTSSRQKEDVSGIYQEIIEDQLYKSFKCLHVHSDGDGDYYEIEVSVKDPSLRSPLKTSQERYWLEIKKDRAILKADFYPGFIRGLETFLQAIQCESNKFFLKYLPISIEDYPDFSFRGLLVDTSRHFIPIKQLYKSVDALMYNKMNVLHWHITDEDSFPLSLHSHPELAEYAAFSPEEVYTVDEVKDLVRYAQMRGVRIIPEIDTPAHAGTWNLAPQNSNLTCLENGYRGMLDVTLHETYILLQQIYTQIFSLFPDPIFHIGGDQVTLTCLKNLTNFITLQNLQDNSSHTIEMHFRKKQRQIIRKIDNKKQCVYWVLENKQFKDIPQGDIADWWGKLNEEVPEAYYGKMIFTKQHMFYIDLGVGSVQGHQSYGRYYSWLDLYNTEIEDIIREYPNREFVIGSEITLWGEINNKYTFHTKIWIRGSSFAERLWGSPQTTLAAYLARLTNHERLMNRRGIPTAPATTQHCQYDPYPCIRLKDQNLSHKDQ